MGWKTYQHLKSNNWKTGDQHLLKGMNKQWHKEKRAFMMTGILRMFDIWAPNKSQISITTKVNNTQQIWPLSNLSLYWLWKHDSVIYLVCRKTWKHLQFTFLFPAQDNDERQQNSDIFMIYNKLLLQTRSCLRNSLLWSAALLCFYLLLWFKIDQL